MRKPIIAGNWKMNMTAGQAVELVEALIPLVRNAKCEVVVCPPFVCINAVKDLLAGTNIKLGAQNMHWEEKGAYTGEVSPVMLRGLGVQYVIIGHSERREYFAETDAAVNKKIKSALAHDLIPIVCVGETLKQREEGITNSWVSGQVTAAFEGIDAADVEMIVIAYEPIWAIGTGRTATPEDANEVTGVIRDTIAKLYGQEIASKVRIQYGGSMNPKNATDLMAKENIDGGLIGGASLKAEDFSKVVNY